MKRMIFFILVLGLLLIAVGCAASKPEPEPEPEFLPDDGVFMFDGDRTYVANDVMLPLMVGNWKSADGRYEMSYDEEQALCIWLDGLCVLQTLGTYIHLEPGGPDYTELLLEDTNLTDEAGQVLQEIAELGFEPSDQRGTMVLKLYDHKTAFSTETIVLEYQEALPPEEEQSGDVKPDVEYASLGEGELLNPDTGDVLAYSYRVCRMEASLPGAQELNEALASGVETIIQQQLDAIYAGQMPEYHSIWCEPHNYAGYYSLVFTLERWVDGSIEYMVYYYDVWRGSQVDISEFLIPQGLDYFEDFLPAAVQAGQTYLLDSNQQLPEEYRAELEDALERTALYVGQYPTHAFIIPDGTIFAIVPVASMAGPDYIYLQLPVT